MTTVDGTLALTVWPAYIGICVEDPGPGPVANGEPGVDYRRGQIHWAMENGEIVGHAAIHAPRGCYTHMAYFSGPEGPCMTGRMQIAHPLRFEGGLIDVYPITNSDLASLNVG